MNDQSGTSQNAKRIKSAAYSRRIPTLDTLARAASTIRESGLTEVQGLKERLALTFKKPEAPITVSEMSQKPEDGRERKKRDPNQNYRRKMHAHETYLRALSKGCHFFFIFLLVAAPRTCAEHKKEIDSLLVSEDTSRYYFSLNNDGCALLDTWAKDDQYNNNPRYRYFLRFIRHPETAEIEDFQTLERIFRERGVYGSPHSIEIIKLLFPKHELSFNTTTNDREEHAEEGGDLEMMEEDSELDRIPEYMEESEGHAHGTHNTQDNGKPADKEDGDLEMVEEDSELDRVPEHVKESNEPKHGTHSVQDLGKLAAFEELGKHQSLVQEGMSLKNYRKPGYFFSFIPLAELEHAAQQIGNHIYQAIITSLQHNDDMKYRPTSSCIHLFLQEDGQDASLTLRIGFKMAGILAGLIKARYSPLPSASFNNFRI